MISDGQGVQRKYIFLFASLCFAFYQANESFYKRLEA